MSMGFSADRSDGELLAGCAGDREAFTAFYRRYERVVLAFLNGRVRDPQLAADLCAETFAAALAGAASYRPEYESAAPWLFGIARNVLGSSLRAGRVEARARRRIGMREPLVLTDEDLERVVEIGSGDGVVLALLAELPGGQRRALEARVIEELAYPEVAERLKCSELVARQRVSRGLAMLRARLEGLV
jgi:RNA polymerase sigma factor (sigma-70 family)